MKLFFSIFTNWGFKKIVYLIRSKIFGEKRFVYYKKGNEKWAYISYIPDVFYRRDDERYLNTHQNKREILVIGDVFAKLGYNFVVELFNSSKISDKYYYDIVFGLEPNFCIQAKKNPNALKIYYATGAYFKHQNLVIKDRTDYFNNKHKCNVPYYRLVAEHSACDMADFIFQIGSKYTLQTYPEKLIYKMSTLHQSSNFYRHLSIQDKLSCYKRNEYLWLGGSGSILKGLDLILDYFIQRTDCILHIVGGIDNEVNRYYAKKINNSNHIHVYGFLDVNSEQFVQIAKHVTFYLFPSASEGGAPGSVIAAMKCGIIPIVSKYASFDEIVELGYRLDDFSIRSIEDAVKWSESLCEQQVERLIKANFDYAQKKWNINVFSKEFEYLLKEKIKCYMDEGDNA